MRILEGEMDLRDETRAVEEAREAMESGEFDKRATGLAKNQDELRERLQKVMGDIRNLENGETEFAKELQILGAAAGVMAEATSILNKPNTGPEAIAAETEVIELLLQSKRCNPNGGGGGGSSPGGGGGGDKAAPALAMFGPVKDIHARIDHREVRQSTGTAGSAFPAEFREGLDSFFNSIENGQ